MPHYHGTVSLWEYKPCGVVNEFIPARTCIHTQSYSMHTCYVNIKQHDQLVHEPLLIHIHWSLSHAPSLHVLVVGSVAQGQFLDFWSLLVWSLDCDTFDLLCEHNNTPQSICSWPFESTLMEAGGSTLLHVSGMLKYKLICSSFDTRWILHS